jgi:DNA-binding MarR family transcriptional regulator
MTTTKRPPRRLRPPSGSWPSPAPLAEAHGPITHMIFRISRKHRVVVANLLRPFGLFPGQELLLMQLSERKGRPQADLVETLGIDHSTVTKMLQRMQASGVIDRVASPDDGRVVLVCLTEEGRRLRAKIKRVWQDMESITVGHLNKGERMELLRLLSTVEQHLTLPKAD